jgi:hypothetical protein
MWHHNVDLLAYHDLDGRSGFKLAIQELDGRLPPPTCPASRARSWPSSTSTTQPTPRWPAPGGTWGRIGRPTRPTPLRTGQHHRRALGGPTARPRHRAHQRRSAAGNCDEPAGYVATVDISDESDPNLMAVFPQPRPPRGYDAPSFCVQAPPPGPGRASRPPRRALHVRR